MKKWRGVKISYLPAKELGQLLKGREEGRKELLAYQQGV